MHETLIEKQGPRFWRVWRSKFDTKNSGNIHVDGVADNRILADKFAKHFQNVCNKVSASGSDSSEKLHDEYCQMRLAYCGDPYLSDYE